MKKEARYSSAYNANTLYGDCCRLLFVFGKWLNFIHERTQAFRRTSCVNNPHSEYYCKHYDQVWVEHLIVILFSVNVNAPHTWR